MTIYPEYWHDLSSDALMPTPNIASRRQGVDKEILSLIGLAMGLVDWLTILLNMADKKQCAFSHTETTVYQRVPVLLHLPSGYLLHSHVLQDP